MKVKREIWIDNVKLLACILVAVGHFLQSMIAAGFLEDAWICRWFLQTIYYFHVPLFFLCSGYLYQKYTAVCGMRDWIKNTYKKFVTLGVPYFTFSFATWLLKHVFSGTVNSQNGDLLTSLFLNPISPYWYLYVLFFLYFLIPTFRNRQKLVTFLLVAVVLKCMVCLDITFEGVYLLTKLMEHMIWFVFGMAMCMYRIPEICRNNGSKVLGLICAVVFLCGTIAASNMEKEPAFSSLVLGLLGCGSVCLLLLNCNKYIWPKVLISNTMPIYLMHTIFAAGVRAVLMKVGICMPLLHYIGGLGASFIGPIIAAKLMQKTKTDFFIYPGRYLKF